VLPTSCHFLTSFSLSFFFYFRLSRARRVAENAFGILANRFRFLHMTIDAEPGRVASIVKAACVLHNYLRAAP
ncbi:hypothetical protein HPB47_020464, partial [Ixodes persulcatus]